MASCPSKVMMLNSDPTGRLFINLKKALFILVHRLLIPMMEVRSSSSTYRLVRGTRYSNVGSEASLTDVGRRKFEVTKERGEVVVAEKGDDVARYRVDATKVGLVGRKVVGGVT